jgi:dethiobiotin synthetase
VTRVFVTASGTDVGKTFVMCRLIAELAAAGRSLRVVKPVATGFDTATADTSDTAKLILAQGLTVTQAALDATTPWRFAAALSPDGAARRENRSVPFDEILAFCAADSGVDVTLIEGVGGVMAPIGSRHTVLDLIEALAPRVLLVVGSYLGSLSHTLTSVEALRARRIEPAAIVVSESHQQPMPLAETAQTLTAFLDGLAIVEMPRSIETKADLPKLAGLVAAS